MKIRLYFDEDCMDQSLVRALTFRRIDVIRAIDVGMGTRDDIDHLEYATKQGRVLCTFNIKDFRNIHADYLARGIEHAVIIVMQQQHYSIGEILRRLQKIIATRTAEDMESQIEFLSSWG